MGGAPCINIIPRQRSLSAAWTAHLLAGREKHEAALRADKLGKQLKHFGGVSTDVPRIAGKCGNDQSRLRRVDRAVAVRAAGLDSQNPTLALLLILCLRFGDRFHSLGADIVKAPARRYLEMCPHSLK